MKKVSIITVNFNQPGVTEELLRSIPDTYANLEVIVVDNGSKINYTPGWQSKYPSVIFIRSEVNLGFAGGNNLGIKAATGKYLFFVNNDTEFTSQLVEKLARVLDLQSEVGIISPKIKYHFNKNLIQYAGYTSMNFYTGRNSCIGLKETDNGQYDHLNCQTAYCHGAAMMVRRTAIEEAGVMSESFFLYYEELDWCEQIKRAGYKAWINTDAVIYHKESVSVGKKSKLKTYFMNRNRILFIRRNAPLFKKIVFNFYFLLLVVPRNLLTYIKDKDYHFISALLKALSWNITNNKNSQYLGYPINSIK